MKDKKKMILICLVVVIVLLIITNIILSVAENKEPVYTEEKMVEIAEESKISKLDGLTEQERIEYYSTNFIRNIEKGNYENAYKVLYGDFKRTYFESLEDFESYCKKYFKGEIICNYDNIERLGDIYVLWITVKDEENKNKNYNMNIVIRENDFDDIDLSFSVNSAVDANI